MAAAGALPAGLPAGSLAAGSLAEGERPPLRLLAELGAEYWNPMFPLVTPDGVAAAHQAGRKVSTWTVDAEDDMRRVVAAGVDAVVSNRVHALVEFLRARAQAGEAGGAGEAGEAGGASR